MRIDGVCCCVGPLYAGYLRQALPVWLKTLDLLTIVYDAYSYGQGMIEYKCFELAGSGNYAMLAVETAAFGTKGQCFNKGAALNEGIVAAKPTDWILSFDSDIIPPDDWRQQIEHRLHPGNLYGSARYDQSGRRLDKAFYPRGFFQLWHVSDPAYRRQPIFDDWHTHAGHYDTRFANQWPKEKHVDLGLQLIHQGEPYKHWFGPDADPELMRELRRKGIAKARARST